MKLGEGSIKRITEVFADVDLGDTRRSARATEILRALAMGADRPLPQVVGSQAELEGMYRFLSSEHSASEAILDGIAEVATSRAKAAKVVLAIHDTTSIKCPAADGDEVGWIDRKTAGFFFHHALIVEPRSGGPVLPLGLGAAKIWGRDRPPVRRAKGKPKASGATLSKQKARESDRWLECVTEVEERLDGCRIVHVMDREADNFR